MAEDSKFSETFLLSRFVRTYLSSLVSDLPPDSIYLLQNKKINSPGWCLGHIAVETDAGSQHLGGEPSVPEKWYDWFYFTAPPLNLSDPLPSKDDLTKSVDLVFERLESRMESMPVSFWQQACHSEFLRDQLPTEKDWYVHILTTHVAMHAGNIAAWRRIRGMPPASYGRIGDKG